MNPRAASTFDPQFYVLIARVRSADHALRDDFHAQQSLAGEFSTSIHR